MDIQSLKTIGILGGMGPMATVNLMQTIIENTQAACDQEHPPVIIDSNTKVPERSSFLLGLSAQNPKHELVISAKRLENAGAACIIMPCNTAHAFYTDIAKAVNIPVLHMVEETVRWILRYYPEQKSVGVLATQGTYSANVYKDALEKFGLKQAVPDEKGQKIVTSVIFDGIKKNNYAIDFHAYEKVITQLQEENDVQVIVLGCTELSVAQNYHPLSGVFANPLQIIAREAIKFSGARLTTHK